MAGRMSYVPLLVGLFALESLTGCTAFDVLNATIPYSGYVRSRDIPYGELPRQKLDVYRPSQIKAGAGVVIFFYGGDWQTGSKADYRFVAQALTERGFVAVMPDYRLYPDVVFPAFVEDGALAVRWAHENAARFGGDPKRVFLMGHSAGAYIAAMLALDGQYLKGVGLDPKVIRATAALSGPYDFVPSPPDLAVFGMSSRNLIPPPQMEPIHFADGTAAPMLLATGLDDKTVDPANAARLATRIFQMGGQARHVAYPGVGHREVVLSLARPFRSIAPVLKDVTQFFAEY